MQQQEGALREMGVQKPLPDSVESRDRYNNRKMTYTRACREHLQELCREYGLDIETEPKEKSQTGRTLLMLKTDTLEQETQGIEARRRMAQRDVEDLHQIDAQVTKQINEGYGELGDIGLQKRDALEELEAIKHSATHARTREQKARERAQKQEMRNRQAEIDSKRVQREYEAQRGNLQTVKAKYEHLQKQVEQVKGFLTIAEQRQLEELQKQVEEDLEL